MKPKLATNTSQAVTVLLMVVAIISCFWAQLAGAEQANNSGEIIRSKRQASRSLSSPSQSAPTNLNRLSDSSSLAGGSTSTASATATAQQQAARDPQVSADSAADIAGDASESELAGSGYSMRDPDRAPKKKQRTQKGKKKASRGPSAARQGGDYGPNYDECDDDDDDDDEDDEYGGEYNYRRAFEGMARNPMRQFKRMMDSAFDRMQGAYDDYGTDYGRGIGTGAQASAISRGDGYSKAISSVTNNGRTRGILSETRNGRTRTRPIGGSRDDDDDSDA